MSNTTSDPDALGSTAKSADAPHPVVVAIGVSQDGIGAFPVKEAAEGEALRPGVVYVAPANLHLTVVDGHAQLTSGPKVSFTRPSIDVLFESVAHVYGARSVGVLLSGGGKDGAAGLSAIRRAGGATIVQDPNEATAPFVPRAALALNGHRVARIDDIPEVVRLAVGEASTR